MYELATSKTIDKILEKLAKKNFKQFEIITTKVREILNNPHHYKNLRRPLQHLKRVHIDKHFVLVFSVDEEKKIVRLENYDHHDNIYKNS